MVGDGLERDRSGLRPGDHACLIYEDPAEQMAAVVSFVTDGLARQERCVYLADDRTVDEVAGALAAAGVEVTGQGARGALVLATWPARNGANDLDPAALLDFLGHQVDDTLAAGFTGLRIAVEMTGALSRQIPVDRLMAYEAAANTSFFPRNRAVALCQYNRRRFPAATIRRTLGLHPLVISDGRLVPNLQYEPPDVALDDDSRAYRVDWMIGELRRTRAAERTLQTLIHASPVPIIALDAELKVKVWNPAAERLFGWTESELLGRSYPLVPAEKQEEFRGYLETVLRGQSFTDVETQRRTRDGSVVDVQLSVAPVHDAAGRVSLIFAILTDISGRKQAEQERERLLAREQTARAEAEAANRTKDKFLATLSHELRTPLNALLLWARVLREGAADPETFDRAIDSIDRNARLQAQLIEDLLDVSRIVSGKLHLDIRPVELSSVIQAVVDAMRDQAEQKGVRVEVALDPSVTPVSGDSARLQQVVWNLLSNAVKFTPSGGRIRIALTRLPGEAQISVSDTGKGIPEHLLPHIFEPFRQADSSTTRSHGGLGLGLAIVRQLVELHGGTITAESAGEERGATFVVTLPLRSDGTAVRDGPPLAEPSPAPGPALPGIRVLLVDDDADTRELIRMALEQRGAAVTAVASASEALEALGRIQPDMLVSDIGMVDKDGYDLIREVRSREAKWGGHVPAVALTAYARAQDQQRALAAGYQAHVAKPIEPDGLVEVLANILKAAAPLLPSFAAPPGRGAPAPPPTADSAG
jgi:PAS domain S-box-containing protein